MRPIGIPANIQKHNQATEVLQRDVAAIRAQLQRLHSPTPEVSIVIPAYNEAENILKTLSSLAATTTRKTVEVIVVNNNSQDNTEALSISAGATCFTETTQGITPARNAGLQRATGKFVLNADGDTIYPPDWIDRMLEPLYRDDTAMVYGTFAFLPTTGIPRPVFLAYEYISDISKWINKRFREEAVNIYGFNSAFRRTEGLAVDSFNHPPGTNEDGWLGVKLREKFKKKFHHVTHPSAIVWTTDRRIQLDGGMLKGIMKRVRRHTSMLR
ncbi:hypothetical protein A0257_11605 [Hymenobacter psoromatis]|nr:hypothetical protein A0257_11605 [Hymenobacter psoromatis]